MKPDMRQWIDNVAENRRRSTQVQLEYFSNRISLARMAANLTQSQLADAVGVVRNLHFADSVMDQIQQSRHQADLLLTLTPLNHP